MSYILDEVPIKSLVTHQGNQAKRTDPDQVARTAIRSMNKRYGKLIAPIVVVRWRGQYVVVDGNGRLVDAIELGWETIPAIIHDAGTVTPDVLVELNATQRKYAERAVLEYILRFWEENQEDVLSPLEMSGKSWFSTFRTVQRVGDAEDGDDGYAIFDWLLNSGHVPGTPGTLKRWLGPFAQNVVGLKGDRNWTKKLPSTLISKYSICLWDVLEWAEGQDQKALERAANGSATPQEFIDAIVEGGTFKIRDKSSGRVIRTG